ncbi:MAG: formate dehydrogenase subunit alpha [Bacillota bacterium]
MMHIKIDGVEFPVEGNETVLEVALANGIDIPHLCYDPHLSDVGACRMCLVEMAEDGRLITACTLQASDGLSVITDSDKVIEARRDMLDLLLSDHYLDCITCEANGDCVLQDLAYEYDISESSYGMPEEHRYEMLDANPFLRYDRDKCILCGKCIRVADELQYCHAIDFAERGFAATIAAPFGDDFGSEFSDCVFCGQCVQACPTAALTFKPSVLQGRDYQLRPVTTVCPYCGVGCNLILKLDDEGQRVVRVAGAREENSPNPAGQTCVKGRFAHEFISHPDRLTTPLIREGDGFREAGWDEALEVVADGLRHVISRYGADAVGGLSSARCTNEENYLMQKFMRAVVGTNNVDHCARLCHASTVAGLGTAFGSGAMTNSLDDLAAADVIFVIGSNPTENHPVIGSMIKGAVAAGSKLIVADPRRLELSEMADVAIQQRPGTDVALINGFLHVILRDGLEDEDFIRERTENLDAVREVVAEYTPEKVEEITGVPARDVERAARIYGSADTASIYFAMGITQHHTGTDNVLTLANLAMVTGNVGRPGTGVNPLRGQNNVQGACDVGALPNVYPGYQRVTDADARSKFSEAWNATLPPEPGLTVVEMLNAAGEDIRALYIMGENPFLSDPDQNHVIEALRSLDFLVVQDIFLTETAEFADVVLPAASFAEKNGTFTNTERRVQRVRQALPAPGEALPDGDILVKLAERLDYDLGSPDFADVMREVASLTPSYGGIVAERLHLGLQWPCPGEDHPGTPILHTREFSRGLGHFSPTAHIPPAEGPDDDYPFVMMTGRMLYHYHTGTMTRRSAPINEREPSGYAEVNEEDARRLGVAEGDEVRISSRRGTIEAPARVGETLPPGHVFVPFHYVESPANRLTGTTLDPVAKIPELKVSAVNVTKAN